MQAAILKKIGQPLSVEEVPQPVPAADEVLVRTRTCGICRTDLHIQDGLAYVPNLPHIPGHEPAGIIAAVGSQVKDLKVGQAVVPHLFVFDHDCHYTCSGQQAQATHLRGIIGVTLPGGFAEYFTAPARNLLPLPEGVPFDVGGLTSCAVITAVHAFRKAHLGPLDSAAVIGAGGVGLILIQLLRAAGVRVAAFDRLHANLQAALAAGAEQAIGLDDARLGSWDRHLASPDPPVDGSTSPAEIVEHIHKTLGAEKGGVDCVFELVGRANTMKFAAALTARGGRIVVIGEEAEFPAIDTIAIAQRELQIIGSRNGGLQDAHDALDLLARGVLRPPVAAHFPLTQINEALNLVRSGQALGRVIVTMNDEPQA